MGELANFSIETESTVLLVYDDGTELRVPPRQLARYLSSSDLTRVQRALKLRRDFWKQNLPKEGLAIGLAGALILVGAAGTGHLDRLLSRPASPSLAPSNLSAVLLTASPSISVAPSPSGEVAGAAVVASPKAAASSAISSAVKSAAPTPTTTATSVAPPLTSTLGRVVRTVVNPITHLLP